MVIIIKVNIGGFSSKQQTNFLLDLFGSLTDSIPILLLSLSISTKVRRSRDGNTYAIFFKTTDDNLFQEFETQFINVIIDKRKIKEFNGSDYFAESTYEILALTESNMRYKADLLHHYFNTTVPTNNTKHICKMVKN